MSAINYNLARNRKINIPAFTLSAAVLLLATLLFAYLAAANFSRQQRLRVQEKIEVKMVQQKLAELGRQTQLHKSQIISWKKLWNKKLAFFNTLIQQKHFSFVAHLDFLEKIFNTGMSIRQLQLVNEPGGRTRLTIHAMAWNDLMELYKKLAPYDLVISNENQTGGVFQVTLSFRIKDEQV